MNAVRETLQDFPQRAGKRPAIETLRIPVTPHEVGRRAVRALLVVAMLGALVVTAAPAAAAESCARKVIDDWFDDGRVDGTYALHCYEDAIDILPADVKVYSSATEDIRRALQAARRGDEAPPARTDPTPDGEDPDTPVSSEDPDDPNTGTTGTPPGNGPGDGDGENEVAGPVDTESASSVPIPLLILAGLALLLVAGGSAGYVIRRVQARRAPPSAA